MSKPCSWALPANDPVQSDQTTEVSSVLFPLYCWTNRLRQVSQHVGSQQAKWQSGAWLTSLLLHLRPGLYCACHSDFALNFRFTLPEIKKSFSSDEQPVSFGVPTAVVSIRFGPWEARGEICCGGGVQRCGLGHSMVIRSLRRNWVNACRTGWVTMRTGCGLGLFLVFVLFRTRPSVLSVFCFTILAVTVPQAPARCECQILESLEACVKETVIWLWAWIRW